MAAIQLENTDVDHLNPWAAHYGPRIRHNCREGEEDTSGERYEFYTDMLEVSPQFLMSHSLTLVTCLLTVREQSLRRLLRQHGAEIQTSINKNLEWFMRYLSRLRRSIKTGLPMKAGENNMNNVLRNANSYSALRSTDQSALSILLCSLEAVRALRSSVFTIWL